MSAPPPAPAAGPGRMGRAIDWCFRDRATDRIVVGQFPNLALVLFLVLAGAQALFRPEGHAGLALALAKGAALGWWAVDEVVRGVNPWRRFLGGGVLVFLVASAVVALKLGRLP